MDFFLILREKNYPDIKQQILVFQIKTLIKNLFQKHLQIFENQTFSEL